MKTIYKIALYAAAGAALVSGAFGCGKKESELEQSLSASKIEAPSEKYSPALQETKQKFFDTQPFEDLADSYKKFSEQLDETDKAFREAIEFEKEYEKEMAQLDEEERQLKEKRKLRDSRKGD